MRSTLRPSLIRVLFTMATVGLCSSIGAARQQESTSSALMPADEAFARAAAQVSEREIGLAMLAQQKTSSQIVRALADDLQQDYIDARDKLRGIAEKKHQALPIVETEAGELQRVKLARLSGSAFDRAYVDAMLASHQNAIHMFEGYARSGADPELRSFADYRLPKLRKQLSAIRDVGASLRP